MDDGVVLQVGVEEGGEEVPGSRGAQGPYYNEVNPTRIEGDASSWLWKNGWMVADRIPRQDRWVWS